MSAPRPFPTKPNESILTKNNQRIRIARIKASSKYEKNHRKISSKLTVISSPNPPDRLSSNSPFVSSPQKSPSNKSSLKTRKIIIRSSDKSKAQLSNEETPSNFSAIESPVQDLSCFIDHLLERFSNADNVTDYFYLNRESNLSCSNFLDSCISLGLSVRSSNLKKIFRDLSSEGSIRRTIFFEKILKVQNTSHSTLETLEFQPKLQDRRTFFSKKRVQKSAPKERSVFSLHKNIENFELLIKRRKSSVKQVLERSLPKEKKLLNLSLRFNKSINPLSSNKISYKQSLLCPTSIKQSSIQTRTVRKINSYD